MPYIKNTWVNGVTEANQTNLTNIENGIFNAQTLAENNATNINNVDNKVTTHATTLTNHVNLLIPSQNGAHGLRFYNALLQYYNGSGWVDIQTGGGGTSTTIVDNLTSTSTTSGLSANQGRVLNEKFSSYLPLSGGTVTGTLNVSNTINVGGTNGLVLNGSNINVGNSGKATVIVSNTSPVYNNGTTSYTMYSTLNNSYSSTGAPSSFVGEGNIVMW